MTDTFIIGYDPGGNLDHGAAVLKVNEDDARWKAVALETSTKPTLGEAVAWLEERCHGGQIVACGVDTLTEWNSGAGGWRPADLALRQCYPKMLNSIVSPNSLFGSMVVNGAAFLALLASRFQSDWTIVTEAHPKVCYFALSGEVGQWPENRLAMEAWLLEALGLRHATGISGDHDHCFDAGMAALAALRGLNGDWPYDLHALEEVEPGSRVKFCGDTHFWWPSPLTILRDSSARRLLHEGH